MLDSVGQPFSHCTGVQQDGLHQPPGRAGLQADQWSDQQIIILRCTRGLNTNSPPANFWAKRLMVEQGPTCWSDLVINGSDGIAFPSVTSPTGTDLRSSPADYIDWITDSLTYFKANIPPFSCTYCWIITVNSRLLKCTSQELGRFVKII